MSAIVKPLHLRLFLEGIEVPIIGAHISSQANQPASASVQIVPSDMSLYLLPRTFVVLFEYKPSLPAGDSTEASESLRDYKLKFSGEVMSYTYEKSRTSRGLTLQCMDLSSYWDTCYQWFSNYSKGGNAFTDKKSSFTGAGKGNFNSVASGHAQVLSGVLNTPPKSPKYKDTKGLLKGIIHMLEMVGGLRYKGGGHLAGFNGVNDFFTVAELRYDLLGMIGALEKDTSSSKIFSGTAYRSWIKNGITSLGDLISFRDALNFLMRVVFHNVYPLTSPQFVRGPMSSAKTEVDTTILTDSAEVGVPLMEMFKGLSVSAANLKNLVSQAKSTGRASYLISAVESMKSIRDDFEGASELLEKLDTDDAKTVKSRLSKAQGILPSPTVINTEGDIKEEADWLLPRAYRLHKTIIDTLVRSTSYVRDRKTVALVTPNESRLPSQLFLPDVFFVAPPKSNVLFPDQYTRMQFSRNFMREVSRLQILTGNDAIVSKATAKILGASYFAPNINNADGDEFAKKGSIRTLLPHEIHSGIIPKMEWTTEMQRWSMKGAKNLGKAGDMYKGRQVGFLNRLANFQFFTHRWAARSLSISGPLNTNLVIGLPALVIDRIMPAKDVLSMYKSAMGTEWRPTQYLGRIVSITDSISQQGGTTSIQLSHARTHRGLDDDFLGVLQRSPNNNVYEDTTVTVTLNSVLVGFRNEFHQRAVRRYVIAYYENSKNEEIARGLISKTYLTPGSKILSVENSTGFVDLTGTESELLGINAAAVRKLTGDDSGDTNLTCPESFQFVVDNTHEASNEKKGRISVEEAMTPGWMDGIWKNDKISENVYQPLIGCDAITDGVVFKGPDLMNVFDSGAGNDADSPRLNALPGSEGGTYEIAEGSIEEAIDSLVALYSVMQAKGMDMGKFIQSYTDRPIANMEDIFGSPGLFYNNKGMPEAFGVTEVVEGYFSRAYGNYNGGSQISSSESGKAVAGTNALNGFFPGVSEGDLAKVSARPTIRDENSKKKKKKNGVSTHINAAYDPRGRAWQRVRLYRAELDISRGLVG